jgi:hypothetical protein
MELTNFLKENQRLQLQIQAVILKITSCKTMCNFFLKKNKEIQDFLDKTNFCFGTLPFNPWTILATWLNQGAPQKLQEIRKLNLI